MWRRSPHYSLTYLDAHTRTGAREYGRRSAENLKTKIPDRAVDKPMLCGALVLIYNYNHFHNLDLFIEISNMNVIMINMGDK